jgi:hypothetical protein
MALIVDTSTFIEAAQSGVSPMDATPASACSLKKTLLPSTARVVDVSLERGLAAMESIAERVMAYKASTPATDQPPPLGGGGGPRGDGSHPLRGTPLPTTPVNFPNFVHWRAKG